MCGLLEIERTYKPEALHVVPARWRDFGYVVDGGVAAPAGNGGVVCESAEHFPAPLAVEGVACDAPHVEQTLDRLGSLQVVCICGFDDEVLFPPFALRDICFQFCRRGEDLGVVHLRHVVKFEVCDFGR